MYEGETRARFANSKAVMSRVSRRLRIRSGIAGFANDADEHFYLPDEYTDPFNNITKLEYDQRDLFIRSSTDPVGNSVRVVRFDYRVLAPLEIEDINANLSEVRYDTLGLPVAVAVKGTSSTRAER